MSIDIGLCVFFMTIWSLSKANDARLSLLSMGVTVTPHVIMNLMTDNLLLIYKQAGRRLVRLLLTICDIGVSMFASMAMGLRRQ